jgi:type I restriction enzyme S subunit
MTEGPYKLPEGWRWAKLGEVCEVWQGKTPPKSTYVSKPTAIKVLKFRDITSEGDIIWDNTERGFLERNEGWRYAKIGDVLVTASAHSPDQIGKKVALLNFVPAEYSRVVVTAELMVFRPLTDLLDGLWLRYWLASTVGYQQLQMQVKEKHLVRGRAVNMFLPLPPLEEQRRIVARIEELLGRVREARRLREEARNDAERLWQAILAQTFPRPGSELPEGWRWVRLGGVCEIWDALRKPVKKKDRRPGDVPYCGANGIIDYVDGYTHVGEFVLLAEDGGFYGPGEPSAYMMSGRFWANNHVHILRSKPDHLTNQFLYYWLIACDLRPFLTGATRPKLTQTAMQSIPIPLPPLEEQRRIVAHLQEVQEKIKALKEVQEQTEAELKRLEQAILEKAFRGEL